ncbi:MAG: 7-carboxy-7-deazaguanine synthase, partial [Marinobacter sp.]|nr:7-carboxy-7-deazaguanine synthase [Marinobacter sp.]
RHYFLSPMASPSASKSGVDGVKQSNTRLATDYCLAHPQWRLTLQMHKIIGID